MISGDRVRQVREIFGLTQAQLAKAASVEQSHISMIEKGSREASEQVIEAIALRTGFSPAFFKRPSGPEFPNGSLLYRKRKAASSSELATVRQLARLVFELNESLAQKFESRQTTLPDAPGDPAAAAALARTTLGLSPDTPAASLVSRLERSGVIVIPSPLRIDDHDAFSLWADTDPRRPVIVFGTRKSGDRQRFSVAHELAHLVMHRAPTGDLNAMEREANAFAGRLLLPEEGFLREVNLPLTLTGLAEMKSRWGVSMQAIVEHAYSLGLINSSQRKYVYRKLSAKGWRRNEPVAIPREKPRLLTRMAGALFGMGYSIDKLAAEVNAPPRLLQDVLAAYAADNGQGKHRVTTRTTQQNVVSFLDFKPKRETNGT